jgi:hypothetical protein
MATIPTLPHGVSDYVAAFDLTSIAVTRDGRLVVTRNPAGAASAWWCPAKEASRLVRHARKDSGDIPAPPARSACPSPCTTSPYNAPARRWRGSMRRSPRRRGRAGAIRPGTATSRICSTGAVRSETRGIRAAPQHFGSDRSNSGLALGLVNRALLTRSGRQSDKCVDFAVKLQCAVIATQKINRV